MPAIPGRRTHTRGGAHAYGDLRPQGKRGQAPSSGTPPLSRCWGRLRRVPPGPEVMPAIPGRRTHTRGGAHAYGDHRLSASRARGGRPPLPELPLCSGCSGRLRRLPPGPGVMPAIPGRRTHTRGGAHAYGDLSPPSPLEGEGRGGGDELGGGHAATPVRATAVPASTRAISAQNSRLRSFLKY